MTTNTPAYTYYMNSADVITLNSVKDVNQRLYY